MDFEDAATKLSRRLSLRGAILEAVADVAKQYEADACEVMLALDELAGVLEDASHKERHASKAEAMVSGKTLFAPISSRTFNLRQGEQS